MIATTTNQRRLKYLTTNERDKKTVNNLTSIVENLYNQIDSGEVPEMSLALRSKRNIEFDTKTDVWKYGSLQTTRSLRNINAAHMLLRTVYTADFIKNQIHDQKSSTLREMYYISEGWGKAKFHSQDESNMLAEDLEVISKCMREDFKLRPEESGAHVYGNVTFTTKTKKGMKDIHCMDDVSDAGFAVPYNVENENFRIKKTDAKFIMAIETGGMFARLIENEFCEKHNCILIHLSGQPARSTRRLIKRLNEEHKIPVTVFTDGDPWSFRIYASVAYGAIKTAHISDYLATPTAQYIGITASDIMNYDLPTDKLSDKDVGALNAELSDPRFASDMWTAEIKAMLELNKKSEQQALAKYGLDYVTDKYLPDKLGEMGLL